MTFHQMINWQGKNVKDCIKDKVVLFPLKNIQTIAFFTLLFF